MNSDKKISIYLLPLFLGIFTLLASFLTGFYQAHNDFWDTVFIARHLDINYMQSWFNTQYPLGYYILVKLIPAGMFPVIPAIFLNALFGIIITGSSLFLYQRFLSTGVSLISVTILALFPTSFHYITVGGPDPASVAFFSIGAILILNALSKGNGSKVHYAAGGFFLGLGAITRYHVLPGSVLFLAAMLFIYRQYWKSVLLSGVFLIIAYTPQFAVSLLTGHGLWETQFGPTNVYDLMYDLSWYHTIGFDVPGSILGIIMSNPLLFLQKYLLSFLSYAPGYIFPLIAAITLKNPVQLQISRALAVWTLLHFGFFSAFTSGRQILMALPFSILCAGFLIQAVFDAKVNTAKRFAIPVLAIAIMILVYKDYHKMNNRYKENRTRSELEALLISKGCSGVNQVFTTDFNLYFRSMPFYIPYFNGGSPRWGTYLYNEEYPEFPVNTLNEFTDECRRRGVRFVVLTERCRLLSGSLGDLYDNDHSYNNLNLINNNGRHKVFEVVY